MRRTNFTSVHRFRSTVGDFFFPDKERALDGALRRMATQPKQAAGAYKHCLSIDTLNPNIKVLEYAVRGPLVIRAGEIEKELEKVRAGPLSPTGNTALITAIKSVGR